MHVLTRTGLVQYLQEARATFRSLLSDSGQQLSRLSRQLGSCVDRARPYYEARMRSRHALVTFLKNSNIVKQPAYGSSVDKRGGFVRCPARGQFHKSLSTSFWCSKHQKVICNFINIFRILSTKIGV